MALLRPLTCVVLVAVTACSAGVAGVLLTAHTYETKLQRISEERQVYMTLANQAVAMSEKSFTFTLEHQETLARCMERLYAPDPRVPVVATRKLPLRGGIGGPNIMRGDSRLP